MIYYKMKLGVHMEVVIRRISIANEFEKKGYTIPSYDYQKLVDA